MIVHEFRIPYQYGQTFTLKPAFDWHVGHRYCDIRALRAYLADGIDNPNCYIVTGGDLADSIVVTDKRYLKSTDGTQSGAVINEQYEMLLNLLKPYKGRIIGIGFGNHEDTLLARSGFHMSRQLAKELDTVSLGLQWAIRILFRENSGRGRSLVVYGHHGFGGGARTEGADITKFSNHASGYEADIFCYGHTHKRQKAEIERIGLVGNKLVAKPKRIFICGSFLKTFSSTDEPTWTEKMGFKPNRLGGVNIFIKPNHNWLEISSDV